MELNVIYEDNHIIVVEKPAGILSQAGSMEKPDMVTLVKSYLKEKYDKPGNVYLGLVHRLDLNVGGLMIFAKTSKAASRLSDSIRKHQLEKHYLAIVIGDFSTYSEGEFKDNLKKDNEERKAYITDETDGKPAVLRYKFLKKIAIDEQILSLVAIELVSGRFHQIRSQMAYHGFPLLGDMKYGVDRPDNNFFLGLYAYEIGFIHPVKKEKMSFTLLPNEGIFNKFIEDINF